MKQDPRFFIDRSFFDIHDILIFDKQYDVSMKTTLYKFLVINPNNSYYDYLNSLLKNNYHITNQVELKIEDFESESQRKPIKVTVYAKK